MKRIVIACDGTWQTLETRDPTNVRLLSEAVEKKDGNIEQIVYYSPGVGTRNAFDKLTGGAFGQGINVEIAAAYTFLCSNYNLGDEIYLFGFSRGAYTVRSLAGLIYSCGILHRKELSWLPHAYSLYRNLDTKGREESAIKLQKYMGHGQTSEDPINSDVRITYLGVWDTVGALGIPDISRLLRLDKKSRDKNKFHNTYVSHIVDKARHAVAVDESRKLFCHTEMNPLPDKPVIDGQIRQVWFPGDHGCIGGGGDGLDKNDPRKVSSRPFSDAALAWMIDEMESSLDSHLKVSRDILDLNPDPLEKFRFKNQGFKRRLSDPIKGSQPLKVADDSRPFCPIEDLHPSLIERWRGNATYRPDNLKAAHGTSLDQK